MKTINKALLIGALGLGAYTMQSNEFKYYGMSPFFTKSIIKSQIDQVCFILGNGANNNANELILRTIGIETEFATAKDHSKEYGEGLGQFDRGTFEDTIRRTRKKDKILIERHFGINIDISSYDDLRKNPTFSIIMIRLKYKLIPATIPIYEAELYSYYKEHYNSIFGASTFDKWLSTNNIRIG